MISVNKCDSVSKGSNSTTSSSKTDIYFQGLSTRHYTPDENLCSLLLFSLSYVKIGCRKLTWYFMFGLVAGNLFKDSIKGGMEWTKQLFIIYYYITISFRNKKIIRMLLIQYILFPFSVEICSSYPFFDSLKLMKHRLII